MGEIWEGVWNNTVVCVAQLFFGARAITEMERNLVEAALEHKGLKDSIRIAFDEVSKSVAYDLREKP